MDPASHQHHLLAAFLYLLVCYLQDRDAEPTKGFQRRHSLDILQPLEAVQQLGVWIRRAVCEFDSIVRCLKLIGESQGIIGVQSSFS